MSETKKTAPTRTRAAAKKASTTEPGPKPKYLVVESTLVAQTSAGELKISLTAISTRNMRELMAIESDHAQFNYLCENIFPPEVDDLPFVEGLPLMSAWFQAFGEFADAELGELSRSSN